MSCRVLGAGPETHQCNDTRTPPFCAYKPTAATASPQRAEKKARRKVLTPTEGFQPNSTAFPPRSFGSGAELFFLLQPLNPPCPAWHCTPKNNATTPAFVAQIKTTPVPLLSRFFCLLREVSSLRWLEVKKKH